MTSGPRSAYAPTFLTFVLGLVFLGATAVLVRQRDAYLPDVVRSGILTVGQLPSRVASLVRALARRREGAPASFVARVAPVVVPVALLAVFFTAAFAGDLVDEIGFDGRLTATLPVRAFDTLLPPAALVFFSVFLVAMGSMFWS